MEFNLSKSVFKSIGCDSDMEKVVADGWQCGEDDDAMSEQMGCAVKEICEDV